MLRVPELLMRLEIPIIITNSVDLLLEGKQKVAKEINQGNNKIQNVIITFCSK